MELITVQIFHLEKLIGLRPRFPFTGLGNPVKLLMRLSSLHRMSMRTTVY